MTDADDNRRAVSDAVSALARQRRVVDRLVRERLGLDSIMAFFMAGDALRARDILRMAEVPESRIKFLQRQLSRLVRSGALEERRNPLQRQQPYYSLPAPAPAAAESSLCVACRDKPRAVLILPCRHLSLCAACMQQVDRCPICRGAVEEEILVLHP